MGVKAIILERLLEDVGVLANNFEVTLRSEGATCQQVVTSLLEDVGHLVQGEPDSDVNVSLVHLEAIHQVSNWSINKGTLGVDCVE